MIRTTREGEPIIMLSYTLSTVLMWGRKNTKLLFHEGVMWVLLSTTELYKVFHIGKVGKEKREKKVKVPNLKH